MQVTPNTRIYDLEQPRYFGAPTFPAHAPGLVYTLHRRHERGLAESRTSASGSFYSTEHSGTHIDALCHQAEDLHLYGGHVVDARIQTSTGFTELGIETTAPFVNRGVLLDVARYRGSERIVEGQPVTRAELEATAQMQDVTVVGGDVVLVRTGNGAVWSDPNEYLRAGGIHTDASVWLAEQHVKAVGADNVAWDENGFVDSELQVTLPGHVVLLVRHGIYIIENLFLEVLARDRQYEFTFICLPLKICGATASPVRPIALVTR